MNILRSRHAVWLTHGSALVMTCALFTLLLTVPFRYAFIPAVLLTHRIGVMMHEYIHGIPFRRYGHCLNVLAFFDGMMLMFGLLELFRATHLSHHRWLNSPGDSAFDNQRLKESPNRSPAPWRRSRRRSWIALWTGSGRGDMVWKLMTLTAFTTAVPVSLRGAIEHHAEPDRTGFANEYRTLIPLFNLNRHVHHHERPTLPWYLLAAAEGTAGGTAPGRRRGADRSPAQGRWRDRRAAGMAVRYGDAAQLPDRIRRPGGRRDHLSVAAQDLELGRAVAESVIV